MISDEDKKMILGAVLKKYGKRKAKNETSRQQKRN